MAAIWGILVNWCMGNQTCAASHSTDSEGHAFHTAVQMNKYLSLVDEWLRLPSKKDNIIYEDNQPLINILNAGQTMGQVKHMAVPLLSVTGKSSLVIVNQRKFQAFSTLQIFVPIPYQPHCLTDYHDGVEANAYILMRLLSMVILWKSSVSTII